MRSGGWLGLSLVLNLGLAVGLGFEWAHRSANVANPAVPGRPPRAFVVQADAPIAPASSELAGLHWSQVESDEYPRYIANLRAWGCPERLVRDIVRADIEALFDRRLPVSEVSGLPPWAGINRRNAARRAHRQALVALAGEQRALLRTLLDLDDVHRLDEWRQARDFWIVVGFLPEEQARAVFTLTLDCQDEIRLITERADGVVLDEDRRQMWACFQRGQQALQARFTPAQFEEYRLRLGMDHLANLHLETLGLTGAEVREIARLDAQRADPLREFVGAPPEHPGKEEAEREVAFARSLADFLGPERHAEYQRAQDSDYRDLFEFVRSTGLASETARRAFEVRTMAGEEADRIDADTALSLEAREQAREALYARTYARLVDVLGSEPTAAYVNDHGRWLRAWRNEPPDPAEDR